MGYSGDYTLLARCVSEGFGTMTFVFFTLALLANKLLPKTKGHDLSFGWLAFGIGLAVFIPVQFLGHISTSLNPAMALGSAIVGNISFVDWAALSLSETIGAFSGALLMYVYYYPQFRTQPEPPPMRDAERLLRTTDDIGRRGLNYVSYNTREPVAQPRLANHLRQLRRRLSQNRPEGCVVYQASDVLGPEAEIVRANRGDSVMVADLHHRLGQLERLTPEVRRHSETEMIHVQQGSAEICVQLMQVPDDHEAELTAIPEVPVSVMGEMEAAGQEIRVLPLSDSALAISGMDQQEEKQRETTVTINSSADVSDKKATDRNVDPLVEASRMADRHMKLAIFCTRPTTYEPFVNLLTEAIATFFLVIGILFIKERSEFMYEGYAAVYIHGIMAFYVGLLIALLVLCLGGMGVAMNPARDLAPRFAHWILRIDGKGPSEWYYAWIPIVGPFMGSVLAAFVFLGMRELNKGQEDGGQYDEELNTLVSLLNAS